MKRTSYNILKQAETAASKIPLDKIDWFRNSIFSWYEISGRSFPWRKPGTSAFHLVLAELLLQRTRAENVAQLFPSLLERFSGWHDILTMSNVELGKLLEPLGLSQRRPSSLKALAKVMAEREGKVPTTRDELEAMPGIGQYIASAILVSLYKIPEPLLDSNMARVLERFFGKREKADIRDDPYLQGLARKAVSCPEPLALNWAILDFAARICRAQKPLCNGCLLAGRCNYFLNRVDTFI